MTCLSLFDLEAYRIRRSSLCKVGWEGFDPWASFGPTLAGSHSPLAASRAARALVLESRPTLQ